MTTRRRAPRIEESKVAPATLKARSTSIETGQPSTPPSGSAIGWSFYKTAMRCWTEWFLKYVKGFRPIITPEELTIGTIYHALHEGVSEATIRSWGNEFDRHFEEGKRLYDARLRKVAIPPALHKEVGAEVGDGALQGTYTSKPDAIERYGQGEGISVREFKTAGAIHEADDDRWAIDGEVIGELVTTGAKSVIVDVVTKAEKPKVRQFEVTLNPEKKKHWEVLILDLQRQIRERLERLSNGGQTPADVFPRTLPACVSYGGTYCPYYAKCWTKGAASIANYTQRNTSKDPWWSRLGIKPKGLV